MSATKLTVDIKSKRRSSFTANRVSLLSREISSAKDLHKFVENDLPKEDRLVKISKLCLQFTLDNLETEFKYSEGFHFESFKTAADERVNSTISRLQDEDVFRHACSKKQQLPNPLNEDFNASIDAVSCKIDRLENESQQWDDYLEQLKKKKTEAEMKCENLELKVETLPDCVKAIAAEKYLKPSPDYQDLIQTTQQHLNKAALQVETYCNNVHLLVRANKLADWIQKSETEKLYKESFKGLPTQDSMDHISNHISLPSPTKRQRMNE